MGKELTRYVTVSTKIPNELKDKMKRLGIKTSEVLRRAIEQEVRVKEVERIKEAILELKPVLNKVPMEEVVRSIRQDREQR
jgi:antitoxin CcdA